MSQLTELARRIEEKLAADDERRREATQEMRERHELRERRLARFGELAGRIAGSIIRPQLEQLTSYFDNATVSTPHDGCSHCVCRFESTPRFPASTTLELSVSHDEAFESVTIAYGLEILPVFLEFEKRDSLTFPMDAVDEGRLERWLSDKLLAFVDTYLELEQIEQYQHQNLVIDPVCGVRINKTVAAAELTVDERSYFFCSDDCRAEFAADPQRYVGSAKP
jgi:YHS domain-containing protein